MSTQRKWVINEPCTEDWDTMTQVANGRHCNVCNKVVVDLHRLMGNDV